MCNTLFFTNVLILYYTLSVISCIQLPFKKEEEEEEEEEENSSITRFLRAIDQM